MEVDPRWVVVLAMIAFYYCLATVVYNGRQVALASPSDKALQLEHHVDSLWLLLRASVLLLVLVTMVVNLSVQHERSILFWVHESLDLAFLALATLAIVFNGKRSVNHKYFGWSMVVLTVPIGITGGILLYHLPMQ